MKIGYDAKRFFFNNTGLGNYSRNLVYSLVKYHPEYQYILFSPKYPENNPELEKLEKFDNIKTVFPERKKFLWRQLGIVSDLKEENIDIYHGLSHEIPLNIKKTGILSVVTVHDLIFEVHPEFFKPIDSFLFRKKYKKSCLMSDKIIAVSESTKRDLIEYYNISEDKIKVIYQTCSENFTKKLTKEELNTVRKRFSLPTEYILYVGSIIERKNLFDIIKVLKILPEKKRVPVVAVGKGGEYLNKIKHFVNKNDLEDLFIHLSNVNNDELSAIYQMATLFVYTSSYEGFGIPVLEALNAGIPVITSKTSSLPEAGGEAALLVMPGDIEELKSSIEKILYDSELRKNMIEKGFIHAKKFSYKKMADETMELYRNLLK